jgi:hypothetical protein
MYIKTWHGTLVVVEANDGQLKHIPLASAAEHEIVRPAVAFEEQKIPFALALSKAMNFVKQIMVRALILQKTAIICVQIKHSTN